MALDRHEHRVGPAADRLLVGSLVGLHLHAVQQTFGTTRFAYNVGAGLRLDVNRMFTRRLGYNAMWLDMNNISSEPAHQVRADFGFGGS